MTYEQALDYLYNQFPVYQKIGDRAMKLGLDNSLIMDERLDHPHRAFRTIHVGGTNGKGSTSHSLAAILQAAGYRVGLYTSPHLVDFKERIRVNGEKISEQYVVDFTEKSLAITRDLHPSFFELTMMMAFAYFREMNVDVAVVEVGLGGRLDSTNIISPDLAVITNIGLEHTQFLGNTLAEIASEKAGIIKRNTPVVIGEYDPATAPVFRAKAAEAGAPIVFASEQNYNANDYDFELRGLCQAKNKQTILAAVSQLQKIGYNISENDIRFGLTHVCSTTGLMGRWQKIGSAPDIIVDTGHNEHGIRLVAQQLSSLNYPTLHIVWAVVSDKRPEDVFPLLPADAKYYITQPNVPRAYPADELYKIAMSLHRDCQQFSSVAEALANAQKAALASDLIFVGGSNFTVAEALETIQR